MVGSQGQLLRVDQCFAFEDTCTPSIVQMTAWLFGDASAEPAGEGLQRLLPDWRLKCDLSTIMRLARHGLSSLK